MMIDESCPCVPAGMSRPTGTCDYCGKQPAIAMFLVRAICASCSEKVAERIELIIKLE